jgi:ATP-dependent DNA ligase
MNVNQKIETLAKISSTNAKVEFIKDHCNDELFKSVVHRTLDPMLNFHIKKIPDHTPEGNMDLGFVIDAIVANLCSRKITGNMAIEFLRNMLNQLSPDDASVIVKMIERDLRCGVSVGLINKAFPNFIQEYPCMLASPYDTKTAKNVSYPAIAQTKEDGLRVNAIVHPHTNTVEYRSRNGKEIVIDNVEIDSAFVDLAMKFKSSIVFDGELLAVDKNENLLPRSIGNGICNKAIKGTITQAECKSLRFKLWDYVLFDDFKSGKFNLPYQERFSTLKTHLASSPFSISETDYIPPKYISLVSHKIVNNLEEAQDYFQDHLKNGLEGIILKDMSMIWEDKRSKKQLKFKAEETADLVVVDWVEGNGKYQGMLGALVCESSDGKIRVNVSGFTDDQRKAITKEDSVGKIIEVLYNTKIQDSKTKQWSLFLPRIVQFRDDKDVANSFDEIK